MDIYDELNKMKCEIFMSLQNLFLPKPNIFLKVKLLSCPNHIEMIRQFKLEGIESEFGSSRNLSCSEIDRVWGYFSMLGKG
jgi:hypothetical protein